MRLKNRFMHDRKRFHIRREGEGDDGGDGDAAGGGGPDNGGTNNQDFDWRSQIPEDLRESSALKDVNDLPSLAKQFVDQQAYLGNSLRIPGEDASEDAVAEFERKLSEKVPGLVKIDYDDPETFNKLANRFGAPEDPSKYQFPQFEDLPDGMEESPLAETLREVAGEVKLTQKQFEAIAKGFTEKELQKAQEYSENHSASYTSLKNEWGDAFDEKKSSAVAAAKATKAPEQMIEAMENDRVPAEVMKWMSSVANQLGEEFIVNDGNRGGGPRKLTPAEAQMKLDEIMENREHPYFTGTRGTPEHARAIERVMELRHAAMGPRGRETVAVLGQQR